MSARVLSAGLSVGYVGSVYILPGGRTNSDDIGVVARRIFGVCLFTIMITANFGVHPREWAGTINGAVVRDVLKAIGLLHVLYAGELLVNGVPSIQVKDWKSRINTLKTLIVGPITEELVYRGVIVSLYKQDGFSNAGILRENFLYFGLAHLHHGLMRWLNEEGTFKQIAVQSLAHFVITSVFGTYACYLLLQTGTVWPSVVSHLLCNYYGPPILTGSAVYFGLSAASVAGFAYSLKYI